VTVVRVPEVSPGGRRDIILTKWADTWVRPYDAQ
jgi:hypothetical protein